MDNVIFTKKNFIIIRVDGGYIVRNIDKEFKDGHTHINNYNTAKYIINLSIHRSIPHHLCDYLLHSLERLTTDDVYRRKVIELRENKRRKSMYYNVQKKSIMN